MDTLIRLRLGINEFGVNKPFCVTAGVRRNCMSIVIIFIVVVVVVVVAVLVVVHDTVLSPSILNS